MDPRIFFAAERTLLAWIRTGIAVIGLGFVVARFGLFLRLVTHHETISGNGLSSWVGVGLVILGALMVAGSAFQHLQFCATLQPEERPRKYWLRFGFWIAVLVSLSGLALGTFLVFTS